MVCVRGWLYVACVFLFTVCECVCLREHNQILRHDVLQLLWHFTLWVFVFEMLLVSLRIGHLRLRNGNGTELRNI